MMRPSRLSAILAFFLLLSCGAQCLVAAWLTGQTTDETFYNGSGYPLVRYNNYEFLGEHPPLAIQLGALPLLFVQPKFQIENPLYVPGTDRLDLSRNGAQFLYKMGNDPNLILFLERLPIVLLTVLLGFGVFCFAGELFGMWGALLSLGLFAFDPNMIAHGSLYTTDMGLTVFYFFSIYALKRFFDAPSERTVVLLGLTCGAVFMSKISGLILTPVILCLFLVYYLSKPKGSSIKPPAALFEKWVLGGIALYLVLNAVGERQAMVLFGPFLVFAVYLGGRDLPWVKSSRTRQLIFRGLVVLGAVLCTVFAWRLKKKYGFSTASILTAVMLVSTGIAAVLARIPSSDDRMRLLKYFLSIWVLAALVIVLGYTDIVYKFYRFIGFGNFTKPLGIVLSHSTGGHHACVDGSFITCDWRYFPSTLAAKTPVLTLALAILGAILLIFSKRSVLIKAIIFVPFALFFGAAMPNRIHIGLRHILPIFPFLFVLGGLPGAAIANMKPGYLKKTLATLLFVFLTFFAGRTLSEGSDHLAYFNELVGGATQGARLAAGSSLNWGQDNERLAEFVATKKIPFITIGTETMNSDVYDYYKIPWKALEPGDLINPAPGFYALGIGYYTNQQNDPRSWFYGKQHLFRVGKTFFIFEVPRPSQHVAAAGPRH